MFPQWIVVLPAANGKGKAISLIPTIILSQKYPGYAWGEGFVMQCQEQEEL